jgi:hypothetical protein
MVGFGSWGVPIIVVLLESNPPEQIFIDAEARIREVSIFRPTAKYNRCHGKPGK